MILLAVPILNMNKWMRPAFFCNSEPEADVVARTNQGSVSVKFCRKSGLVEATCCFHLKKILLVLVRFRFRLKQNELLEFDDEAGFDIRKFLCNKK